MSATPFFVNVRLLMGTLATGSDVGDAEAKRGMSNKREVSFSCIV